MEISFINMAFSSMLIPLTDEAPGLFICKADHMLRRLCNQRLLCPCQMHSMMQV